MSDSTAVERYLEDFTVGQTFRTRDRQITAEEIKRFAADFDPQPFHLDEAAAERSHFGALVASGWHSAVVWMRLMVDQRRRSGEAARARGERVAAMGPALGLRELKWLKPVFAEDTIDYASEVIEARVSASKPGLGLISIRSTGVNQRGEPVISFVSTTFVERRPVKA